MRVALPVHAGALVLCLASPYAIATAAAVEPSLSGAWAQDSAECKELFSRSGKSVAFKKSASVFAQAFIISGSQVRTPQASCRIKAVRKSGERRILTLACATSVSVDEVPAILAPSADGSLRRYLNGADTTGSKYERCPL
jgi:hypothetical protein